MKNYKKPIAVWIGITAISIFSMTSTGTDYLDFQDPVINVGLVATSSDAVVEEEPMDETVSEIETAAYEPGWNKTMNGYSYISAIGEPLTETWVTDSNGRYYLGKDGIMFLGGIRKIKDSNYCFDETGNVQIGRFLYGEAEYYASDTGQLYSDEWILDNEDTWYYVSENGEIMKDSVTPDGYQLDADGHIIREEEDELSRAFSYMSNNSHRELILKAKTGKIIWDFLKGEGWTDTAVAGVLGNFQQESGLTADMHQRGGGTGYGLGQWTGDRRYALEAYARNTGQDVRQLTTQLNYLIIEPGERDFVKQYAKKEYDSPSEAALSWARGWERYNEDGSIYSVRIPYAEAYYAYFVKGENFVVAREPDYIEVARTNEAEELEFLSSDGLVIPMSDDMTVESVSDPATGSTEEQTEGYGPAFDTGLNPGLATSDTTSTVDVDNSKPVGQEIPSESVLSAESRLEPSTEEVLPDGSKLIEDTQPENYGPGYTSEEGTEIENTEEPTK